MEAGFFFEIQLVVQKGLSLGMKILGTCSFFFPTPQLAKDTLSNMVTARSIPTFPVSSFSTWISAPETLWRTGPLVLASEGLI